MHAPVRLVQNHLAGAPAAQLEIIHDNALWAGAAPRLSIIIPVHKYDASSLVAALASTSRALAIEIVIHDDGSRDHALLSRLVDAADHALAAVRVVSCRARRGQAGARNRALSHARADWRLMLDADMAPDQRSFIDAYLDAIAEAREPGVIVGGFSLQQAPDDRRIALHRWQVETSECFKASERQLAPGRYAFGSNVAAHRAVLAACPFEDAFLSQSSDDADWGLRVHAAFPVRHIDNTVTRLGLDDDAALMSRYAHAGASFALLAARHPKPIADTPLYRAANLARRMPFRAPLAALAAQAARASALPVGVRGRALTAWRALVYAGSL